MANRLERPSGLQSKEDVRIGGGTNDRVSRKTLSSSKEADELRAAVTKVWRAYVTWLGGTALTRSANLDRGTEEGPREIKAGNEACDNRTCEANRRGQDYLLP
jgi:hypothetical protein